MRRFLGHAIAPGTPLGTGMRLGMRGRIRVGRWLAYEAEWAGDGRSFEWRATAGWGRLRPLRVVDRFSDGAGSMDVRVLGRLPLVRDDGEDTVRSGAGRAAIEAVNWVPAALLPGSDVEWRVESETQIVATWDVPPERPEIHLEIDREGALLSTRMERWNGGDQGERGYLPFGGRVGAERRFGGFTLPSSISVGWWFGTDRYRPFFEAELTAAEPLPGRAG